MEKIFRIGTIKIDGSASPIFINAKFNDGNLSLTGVIGPMKNGNAKGGCGQIDIEFAHRNEKDNEEKCDLITPEEITFAPGWNKKKWFDLLDIWKQFHLNDMQAGCEHQRKNWNTREKLELIKYSWSHSFYQIRQQAQDGELVAVDYMRYQIIAKDVLQVTITSPIKWESPLIKKLLIDGWIEEKKREIKTASWILEKEHPKGLLLKPCEVCGYKYGSSWLKMEVPKNIIDKLFSFPETDTAPAWI